MCRIRTSQDISGPSETRSRPSDSPSDHADEYSGPSETIVVIRRAFQSYRPGFEPVARPSSPFDAPSSLGQSLDQFDEAVERGAEGRRLHIGAKANLDEVADEVVQIVKILDGLNRFRFTDQPDLLAAWSAASNVVGPRTGGQTDGGTVRPSETASQARQAA